MTTSSRLISVLGPIDGYNVHFCEFRFAGVRADLEFFKDLSTF